MVEFIHQKKILLWFIKFRKEFPIRITYVHSRRYDKCNLLHINIHIFKFMYFLQILLLLLLTTKVSTKQNILIRNQ